MASPRSLRTLILTGLAVLNLAVVLGITGTVYAHARRQAQTALHDELRLRAKTLSGIVELDTDGDPEFEGGPRTMPDYHSEGSGVYAAFYSGDAKWRANAPTLGDEKLPPTGAWREGHFDFREIERGPDDVPVAVATYSFLVEFETPPESRRADWTPPSDDEVQWQVVVAVDQRPRDEALAGLAWFLAVVAAGALAITGLGGLIVARRVLDPLERMTAEAAALTPQDTSRRLQPDGVVTELGSLAETLNSALDRLGAALDGQRRFTSDASHELRTPLAVILGSVDFLLRRDRTAAEYRKGLERQKRVALRMTDITENLLTLARADDRGALTDPSEVNLTDVTRGVCDEFETVAAAAEIGLECAADDDVLVCGSSMYLGELVQNLVSNAVKFTPAGGTVRITLVSEGTRAVLTVEDSGVGIAPEHRARIFDRFFRVTGRGEPVRGAGLGLAIVDWIVKAHAGEIEVQDRAGGGTVFTVSLPVLEPSRTVEPSPTEEPSRTSSPRASESHVSA